MILCYPTIIPVYNLACLRTSTGTGQILPSTPVPITKAESAIQQRSCFSISQELLQSKSYDICDDNGATSAASTDGLIEYVMEEDAEKDSVECQHDRDIYDLDGDSHDEGLGDIFSDEITESIVPDSEVGVTHTLNNETCGKAILMSANSSDRTIFQPVKGEKERRPSRIAYETPF